MLGVSILYGARLLGGGWVGDTPNFLAGILFARAVLISGNYSEREIRTPVYYRPNRRNHGPSCMAELNQLMF